MFYVKIEKKVFPSLQAYVKVSKDFEIFKPNFNLFWFWIVNTFYLEVMWLFGTQGR